jgi:hypothetical protein
MLPKSCQSKQSLLLIFILAILTSACVRELDLKIKDQSSKLVVYGNFTQGAGNRVVSIRRTSDFGSQVSEIVRGANVFLVDEQGKRLPFMETSGGDYAFMDARFQATVGRKYYLEIELKGGDKFRSVASAMPAPIPIQKSYFRFLPTNVAQKRPALGIMVDLNVPASPQAVHLRWGVRRIWQRTSVNLQWVFNDFFRFGPPPVCYMSDSLTMQAIPLFSSERTNGFLLQQQQLLSLEADKKLFEKNAIEIIQYNTTPEAYQYWQDIRSVANQGGTIFDPPPASVLGNLYPLDDPGERILGFFELTAADTSYFFMEKSQLEPFGYYVPDPCIRDFGRPEWNDTYNFEPGCAFCTNIVGHSLVRPGFWR